MERSVDGRTWHPFATSTGRSLTLDHDALDSSPGIWTEVTYEIRIQARLAGEPFQLELVNDPEQRRQGLMGREALLPDSGMLFDFPPGTRPAIWMRNMRMALDLLFVDGQDVVAHRI